MDRANDGRGALPLGLLATGESGEVAQPLGGGRNAFGLARLEEMGLRPGARVEVLANEGQGPLLLRLGEHAPGQSFDRSAKRQNQDCAADALATLEGLANLTAAAILEERSARAAATLSGQLARLEEQQRTLAERLDTTESAMLQAARLAAVGQLAASIAHEINNPLATISACAESLEQRAVEGAFDGSDGKEDLEEYLGLIKSEAFRCKSITTGLLDFSRSRTGDRHPVDINDILRSSANLISHQRRGDQVKFELELADELPKVDADGGQIQQAVIALATNAIDAMPEGGTLTFRSNAQHKSIAIEIEDTGTGIPAEDLSKIFESFFTTKEVGKGTGLGLAICYGIITDHTGRLIVRSNVGKGTTFTILLPVTDAG